MRIVLVTLFLVLINSECIASPSEEVAKFFASRSVLATIYFNGNSNILGKKDLRKLCDVANVLSNSENKFILRIEGIASRTSNKQRPFAIAKVVVDQLNAMTDNKFDLYLTGDISVSGFENMYSDRVEIVKYDNVIGLDSADIKELITDINSR